MVHEGGYVNHPKDPGGPIRASPSGSMTPIARARGKTRAG
nr:glycosyl hydrolase 108 family protein [Mesorhizobium amorphae]